MKTITISDETYEKIKEQITMITEEEAKPEIRHTSYGIGEDGHKRIAISEHGSLLDIYNEMGCKNPGGRNPEEDLWVGNLFDELEGMNPEMKVFRAGNSSGIVVSLTPGGIKIARDNGIRWLSFKEARRFARAILVFCANAKGDKK